MNFRDQLTPAARGVLDASVEVRAAFITRDRWVHTPDTKAAIQWMEYLYRSARTLRPQCVQLIGDPGAGKSATQKCFVENHPVVAPEDPLRTQRPVLFAEATADVAGARGVRHAIMTAAWPGAKTFRLTEDELDDTLTAQGVRVVLVDEVGELFKSGPAAHRRALSELKRINNRGINLVAATVTNLAHVFNVDGQFATRFTRKVTLRRWEETQDLRNFLFGYECELPFPERSLLDSERRVRDLVAHSEGNTANLVNLIKLAGLFALDRKAKFISADDFKQARESPLPPAVGLRVAV